MRERQWAVVMVNVIIVDSGVNQSHPAFQNESFHGYGLSLDPADPKNVVRSTDFSDFSGHGTAIYHIIRKKCPFVDITMVRVFGAELTISEELLLQALTYVFQNEQADIINLSLGINVCQNKAALYDICKKITDNGTIIVSAFDNSGAISYPAAFDCVIGVDGAAYISNEDVYEYVEGNIINMRAKGSVSRLAWLHPEYIVTGGSSFACAYATAAIANQMNQGRVALKENAAFVVPHMDKRQTKLSKPGFQIHQAALFPFNKEMHSLARFCDLLDFTIQGVYDHKYSGRVGASTNKILGGIAACDFIVQDIDKIVWEDIDTLILGHLHEFVSYINNKDLRDILISSALTHGVNVYSFDPVDRANPKMFYPAIDEADVPENSYGKLYIIPTPVVGVFGTSSKQGKFTLQLTLRRNLMERGYAVGQMGTEPNSLLFGMDEIFPFGYGKTVHLNEYESVLVLNRQMQAISDKGYEIIIVGSQSGTVAYDKTNLTLLPLDQLAFLYGVCPDAVVLAVNPHDDTDYIQRTVSFIESTVNCKVVALSLFPMKLQSGFSGLTGSKVRLTEQEQNQVRDRMSVLGIPIYALNDPTEMEALTDCVIDFFSGAEEEKS